MFILQGQKKVKIYTPVVCGLILKNNQILICQRKEDDIHSLKWEFPGGKIKKRESFDFAICRELFEELNIVIQNPKLIYELKYTYEKINKSVHLKFFLINSFFGSIKKSIHINIKWVNISELINYDFLEANKIFIEDFLIKKI